MLHAYRYAILGLLLAILVFTLGYIAGTSSPTVGVGEVTDEESSKLSEHEDAVAPGVPGEVAGAVDDARTYGGAATANEAGDGTPLYSVTRVIDGDTIEVLYNGVPTRVRYIGVDTPETVHPSRPVECYGKEASERNKALVLGQSVRLERDITDTDRYGRLLRYVYVGDVFVNYALVVEGYAHARTYPPDVRHSELFREAEYEAREAGRGLWGPVCTGEEARDSTPAPAVASEERSCIIKGNINTAGEKIYHMPGCGSYDKTRINEAAGERWFCTEREALDAGWRKALNC